ncbi:hypothetical protein M9H77_21786 [Catharanthus roseus]|uniref:Uncharacterized protein n=1 Tax=Catharanthus roseus TaxID=4058 RepID=A0ACC0AR85_CATRO|nr:hypothetical protein M9H77_21786 [Catharanthus roseus]
MEQIRRRINQEKEKIEPTVDGVKMLINGLARQYQGVARDVEELKKGKGSATIEQRFGTTLEEFLHLIIEGIMTMYLFMDIMTCQLKVPIYFMGWQLTRSGRRGGLGGRGYNRPQEEESRHEACHKDNLLT